MLMNGYRSQICRKECQFWGEKWRRVDVRPHPGRAERKWILFPAFCADFAKGAALGGGKWDGRGRIFSLSGLPCIESSYKERVGKEGKGSQRVLSVLS